MKMARRSSGGTATQPKAGVLTEIVRNAQLAWHLLTDHRVSLITKLVIPGLMVGYLLWPIDLLPDVVPVLGQLDDLAILALGIKLFIELCPKDVVREYRGGATSASPAGQTDDGDTLDAEYRVVE
jgi:uncharacterized membrane protein YkvA (DUF1232 family)